MNVISSMVRQARISAVEQALKDAVLKAPRLSELTFENLPRHWRWGSDHFERSDAHAVCETTYDFRWRPEPEFRCSQMAEEAEAQGHQALLEGLGYVRKHVEAMASDLVPRPPTWSCGAYVRLRITKGQGRDAEVWLYQWGLANAGVGRWSSLGDDDPHHLEIFLRRDDPLPMGKGQVKTAFALARAWAERNPTLKVRVYVECWSRAGRWGRLGARTRMLRFEARNGQVEKA